jgi:hypothetical protein
MAAAGGGRPRAALTAGLPRGVPSRLADDGRARHGTCKSRHGAFDRVEHHERCGRTRSECGTVLAANHRAWFRRPCAGTHARVGLRLRADYRGYRSRMAVPGADQAGGRPLEELAQTVSQQALVLAREQADVAGRALTAKAREASTGVAMVGGGALLAALASGTGTAALILLLSRRPGASAAALGVTGAYAGAATILAREGLVRLREAGPSVTDVPVQDEPVQSAKHDLGSAKRRTKTAAKSPQRTKSAVKSPPQPKPTSPGSRRRASTARTNRTRRQAS